MRSWDSVTVAGSNLTKENFEAWLTRIMFEAGRKKRGETTP